MNKKLLLKCIFIFMCCIPDVKAESTLQLKDPSSKPNNSHAGLWLIIVAILTGLLILSYILTKAIDKRTKKKFDDMRMKMQVQ